ncbi:hypothetical protein [Variovorax boronicumulans]
MQISTASTRPAITAGPPVTTTFSPTAFASEVLPVKAATAQPQENQTLQPITVQMPQAPKLEWWEVHGVSPSIAAVVAVFVTAASLHWNTSRNLKAARKTTDDQFEHARQQANEDRTHAAQQANEERDHSAEQAKRDRLMEARKAVYGDLIDDYRKVQELIGGLPNIDPIKSPDFAQPLTAMSASVNKLWIWGEVDTVEKVREFYSQVNEMFYEALTLCGPIQEIQREIARKKAHAQKLETRGEDVAQHFREFKRTVPPHERQMPDKLAKEQQLQGELIALTQQIHQLRAELVDHNQENAKAIGEYSQFITSRQAKIMDQINKVMAAARAEVGLAGDIAILERQSEEMSTRAEAALNGKNSS